MMNPIDEMHKLSNMSYDELCRVATNKLGFCPNGRKYSKVEVITYIVAQMAIRDYFGDNLATANEHEHERRRFVLEERDDTIHHVMLTKEQIDFMRWCEDKGINFYDIAIDEMYNIEWEKP